MADLYVVRKGGIQSSVDAAIAAQKGAANGVAPLDANSKVPAANSRVASVADRQGAILLTVDDVSGAVADTDTRLSDNRTPTDGSVTNASVAANAAIAESKLVLASDGPVGTATRRTLGTGAQQAAAGNDTRFHARSHNLFSADHPDVDETDVPANLEVLTYDATAGKWKAAPAGGVLSADESREGTTRQATAQQIIDGAAGNLFATVAKLKAYIDSRFTPEAWIAPTLTNGWVNFGASYGTAAFRKEPYGLVRLRGVVKSGTTGTASPIFTLPVGYRPAAGAMNPGENNGPYQTVDVQPDGKVSVYGSASNVRVSLDAVVFAV